MAQAHQPILARIDQLEGRLQDDITRLEDRIEGLEASVDGLRADITALTHSVAHVRRVAALVEAHFPNFC
jgi:prefoldin subunit 5